LKLFKGKDAARPGGKAEVRFPSLGAPIPVTWEEIERYSLNAPFAYAVIAEDPSSSERGYYLDEIALTPEEAYKYTYILDTLENELTVPRSEVNPKEYFALQARKIMKKYGMKATKTSWSKILYYAERDLVGFGVIDGMMRDVNIEDITVDAVNKPIFIYHRKYEDLQTNIVFSNDTDLDNLISRLSHMAGRHISTAFPIVQGTLPGRHRLSATFRREVSPYGATMTIRKFREDPITIIDMLNMNVLDHNLASYLWLLMENRATATVAGATASGKTTLLNALLTLTRTNAKIVTIEEVQEINIAHVNWTALVSRQSYGTAEEGAREVGLFDLVKAAMRMRPEIIVVGEVRGEEAYVLFQAISTGHGGLCSLHADDAESAIQRLTSKPMDVPASFIPFLDLILTVRRVTLPGPGGGSRIARRLISIDEVVTAGNLVKTFTWNPTEDKYAATSLRNSVKLAKLSKDLAVSSSDLIAEMNRRGVFLRWLQQKGIRNYRELSGQFENYGSNSTQAYERASKDLGLMHEVEEGVRL
jgi:flagellar protein FlaI